MTTMPAQRYDRLTIGFHWLCAVLILGLWLGGLGIDLFPKGPLRVFVRSVHMLMGLSLMVVLLMRLTWKFTGSRHPEPVANGAPWQLAQRVHGLLLLLTLATVVVGMLCAWVRGEKMFDWWTFPAFDPGNRPLRKGVGNLHEWLGHALMALVFLHAMAAVWHQHILKDGLMDRMRWRRLRPTGAPLSGN